MYLLIKYAPKDPYHLFGTYFFFWTRDNWKEDGTSVWHILVWGIYINTNFTIYSSHYIDQSMKSVILCDNEDKTEWIGEGGGAVVVGV